MRDVPIDIFNIDVVSDTQVHALYLAAREAITRRNDIMGNDSLRDIEVIVSLSATIGRLESVIDEIEEAAV